MRAVVLLALYPFALFFSAAYSEALFLLCSTSAVLAWSRDRPGATLLWGVLTGLSRSNGWTLAFALIADRLWGGAKVRGQAWAWLAGAPLVGAALYSAYVYAVTGYAFEWAAAQQGWGATLSVGGFFARHLAALAAAGAIGYVAHNPLDALTFAATVAALAVGGHYLWRRQWLLGVWIIAYLLPALAIDLPAIGRLTSVLVPVFFYLAETCRGRWHALLATAFVFGQLFLAAEFFRWRPPY